MATSEKHAVTDLASTSSSSVPAGDDRHDASAVLNQVLERTLALDDELRGIANRHFDKAPASCEHIVELTAILSRMMLDWIEARPA